MIEFGSLNTGVITPTATTPEAAVDASPAKSTKDRFDPEDSNKTNPEAGIEKPPGIKSSQDLDSEEIRELSKMKQRDREVKAHEQAHIAAGGSYVKGGAKYEYEEGPDGKKYAVEGEVQIDTSKVPGDPEATLRKMQVIREAAMAPATPSATDRKIAAQAANTENQARMEILAQRYEEAAALRTGAPESETDGSETSDMKGRRPTVSLGGLIDISQ
jgi:hypothetical protein